ncbi:hypothetical protein AB432_023630 [Brevibacillus brevis]|uniref:Uncharacterized protein n=1 Tax=Brevibacillus brevis TaxID=1393 RepID=A0A2Z4MMT6_BREBE|nr:hypothetical protein [Brevibacillus brevis]AWX57837.1 hypothetical protein AB432_023630 [Brevibacillus brevis]
MLKALGFGAILQILCMIIAMTTGNIDQAGNYAEYLAFGLLTLAGLMVYNALSTPSAYYQEHEVQDYKSRWKWTLISFASQASLLISVTKKHHFTY